MADVSRLMPGELPSALAPWADHRASLVVVDLDAGGDVPAGWTPRATPVVVVGVGATAPRDATPYDAVLDPDDPMLEPLLDAVREHPVPAVSLAVLLRATETATVEAALAAESAVYSTLQAGAEFGAWLASRSMGPPSPDDEPVLVERAGDELRVTLHRPRRHNAVDAGLRDALVAALAVAVADDSVTAVTLRGAGPSFSSGGDLAEFGSFPDPATAHVTRLTRSPARLLHALAPRLHVHLHGACLGAGIEWAAFAGRITASGDAVIGLPELDLGLIPGAGGTASIPRRVGRHRALAMALSRARLDAPTALAWGLVDEIV